MLATERLLDIELKFGNLVDRIVPTELDGETIRLILYLKDGTNLRVTEQWSGTMISAVFQLKRPRAEPPCRQLRHLLLCC